MFADIATLLTVRGRRSENQDRAFAALIHGGGGSAAFVACVLDGMGGMRSGGDAAGLAAAVFLQALAQRSDEPLSKRLATAISAANAAVWQRLRGEGGTTLSAVAIDGHSGVFCVHVGDSRVYALDDSIVQVTTDDTLAGLLGEDRSDFVDSALMQFVGMGEGMLHQSFDLSSPLSATLLLTTDGLHSLSWLTQSDLFDLGEMGFDLLNRRGDLDDNATAVIVDVVQAAKAAANCDQRGIPVTLNSHRAMVCTTATQTGKATDDI